MQDNHKPQKVAIMDYEELSTSMLYHRRESLLFLIHTNNCLVNMGSYDPDIRDIENKDYYLQLEYVENELIFRMPELTDLREILDSLKIGYKFI